LREAAPTPSGNAKGGPKAKRTDIGRWLKRAAGFLERASGLANLIDTTPGFNHQVFKERAVLTSTRSSRAGCARLVVHEDEMTFAC
jgi:hypothetical protein